MSAYICSDRLITGILRAARPLFPGDKGSYYWNGSRHDISHREQEVGQILIDENYRSVNDRYDDESEPHTFQYMSDAWLGQEMTPVQMLKLCLSYRYQACETEDWKKTEAHAIVHALMDDAIRKLPGYEEAAWSI